MSDSLKLSLCAVGGFFIGLFFGSLRPIPPDVKVWEARVVRYQKDSTAYERMLAVANGEVARLADSARILVEARVAAVARADIAAQSRLEAKRAADSLTAELASSHNVSDSLRLTTSALAERTREATAAGRENWSLREGLKAQIVSSAALQVALNVEKAAHDSTKRRLAIADDLLRDRPATDRCRVLWFDCPSRTATAVGGFVLGVVGGVYVATR